MFGFGLRYKLERAEAALGPHWQSVTTTWAVSCGAWQRDELRRQRDHFRAELDRLTAGGRLESA